MFNTIEIDRSNLTTMGVNFSDLKTIESTANALGSNRFEGFKPTQKGIEIIRDHVTVNQRVAGSSPAKGAHYKRVFDEFRKLFFCLSMF